MVSIKTYDDDAVIRRFIDAIPQAVWPEGEQLKSDVARVRQQLTLYRRALPYLEQTGWLVSAKFKRSVDRDSKPIPWYTYPAISFLSEKDLSDLRVFEFGSGGSTIWWAGKARQVVAVEHAKEWVDEVRPQLPDNVDYFYEPLTENGPYSKKASSVGGKFDVVIVDGRDRVNCAVNSMEALSKRGVIIWDNAERSRYRVGCAALMAAGFRRVNFHGMGPIHAKPTLTSIFYRDDNCLGL